MSFDFWQSRRENKAGLTLFVVGDRKVPFWRRFHAAVGNGDPSGIKASLEVNTGGTEGRLCDGVVSRPRKQVSGERQQGNSILTCRCI